MQLKSQKMRKLAPELDPLRIGTGWTKEGLGKVQVIVESTYGDSHPGSGHLNILEEEVRKGIAEEGGFGARYHCTDICDGESQGTDGINYSLASREMIANMIEIHANATPFDAGVYLSSCDKGVPGNLIGLARVDIPVSYTHLDVYKRQHLNRALEKVRCDRRLDQEIIRKGSLALTDEDFAKLQQCGYVQENYQKMDFTEENSFDTVYVMERQMPVEKILAGMKKIFADPSCGAVFRIKGFMQEENGSWIEVNATRHELKKQPIKEGQEILIVIGEGLQEAAIRKYLS